MARMNAGEVKEGGRPEPGMYHFSIESAKDCVSKQGNEGIEVDCVVLAGSVDGMEGRKLTGKLYAGKIVSLAQACEVVEAVSGEVFTRELFKRLKATNADMDLPAEDFEGRQFVADVVLGEEFEGRDGNKIQLPELGWKFFHPRDPRIEHVKKDLKSLEFVDPMFAPPEASGGAPVGAGAGAANGAGKSAVDALD